VPALGRSPALTVSAFRYPAPTARVGLRSLGVTYAVFDGCHGTTSLLQCLYDRTGVRHFLHFSAVKLLVR
jgi:hypothetical protein